MQYTDILQRDEVKTVCTKFYFKKKKMYYKIVVTCSDEDTHLFKDFDNYKEYQKYHDSLVKKLNKNNAIPNDFAIEE